MWVPERTSAVPSYLSSNSKDCFKDAAPGHKFLGYLRNTQGPDGFEFASYKGKAKIIGNPPVGQPRRDANAQQKAEFDGVLNEVCEKFPSGVVAQISALRTRQQALFSHHGPSGLRLSTTSTAPFATGLGNEHPIENGFAFLTPYGLPYLAGSGVKGILRRSMQELQNDGEAGFTDEAINALFGPETVDKPEDARRGALDFWDVFPQPAGNKLVVEIMTPHFGKYYQGDDTPHDSGAPVPVSFLAVPAKSQFDFHVVCQPGRLPEALQNQWRALLNRAFQHAFEWVGFGAKTSVGYGAMAATASPIAISGAPGAAVNSSTGSASPATSQTWPGAQIKFNRTNGALTVTKDGKQAVATAPKGRELLDSLPPDIRRKIETNQFVRITAFVADSTLVKVEA